MYNCKKPNDIAIRIKQRRKELGLSLQDVSEIANISRSTLQRYETGSIQNIPLHKLGQLARALETSADWILGWSKDPNEITSLDVDFKNILRDLDFTVQVWGGHQSRMYLSNEIGTAGVFITSDEYQNLRNSVTDYVKFNATRLYQKALKREKEKLEKEKEDYKKILNATLNSTKK